jgi:hypothetical protein
MRMRMAFARRLVYISGTVRDTEEVMVSKQMFYKPVFIQGYTAAPTLPWGQKLELNEYLRIRSSD